VDQGLTLEELADRMMCAAGRSVTPQHISEVERAKVTPSQRFVTACDATLRADGALLLLLPAAIEEREARRDERTEARRAARQAEARQRYPVGATATQERTWIRPTDVACSARAPQPL
jgi:transcriptional regulator with XRE-family HTH domain